MPVTTLGVGAYVSTSGGGRGRIVDRQLRGSVTWWLVKLATDKGALLWYRSDNLAVME
ncbi:MAG TPA: hypothetical protein VGM70_08850 [Pseudolysinimonas sp.]